MAPRIGFTRNALRLAVPGMALESDHRVLWKKGDQLNLMLWRPDTEKFTELPYLAGGIRELRAIVFQLTKVIDQHEQLETEEVF